MVEKCIFMLTCVLILVLVKSVLLQTTKNWLQSTLDLNSNSIRKSKLLPIFTVLQIGPGQCTAHSGELGTCLPGNECVRRGGVLGGPCGAGYAACCIFMKTCNGIIRENGTYFINPNHPDAFDSTGNCQVTVLKIHPDICQIRLDFDLLVISGPEPINHACNTDQLLVSGGSIAPTICGTSSGDHMYIDAGLGQSNPVIVSIITSGPSFPRVWRIRISQIPCTSIFKADPGCLQYYTGITGRIKSFNFNTITGRQLSNQDYSICIRPERNFCSMQLNSCPDPDNERQRSFTLSGNSNNLIPTMLGSGTQNQPNSCPNDWLLIGCIRVADRVPMTSSCEDRVCGGTFNAEVSTTPRTVLTNVRPFRFYFHTDGVESPNDMDNRGFCLDYIQQPCTSN